MRKFEFLVVLLVKSVDCGFFELTDVDDSLSLLWQTKDFSFPQRGPACSVILEDGSAVTGQCKHKTHCLLSGGKSHGNGDCGFLSTCCIQHTICFQKTRAKVSYFSSRSEFVPVCEYVVEAQNDNVCQVRIDFETFHLSPAHKNSKIAEASYETTCSTDYMTISPNTYNIPQFCGNNDGQHVYVHLYRQRTVTLHMRLQNRLVKPEWKLKITQLECPGPHNFYTKPSSYLDRDFGLLAPEGATQFMIKPSGQIKSFGFDNSSKIGDYISGLHYTIAFKKSPYVNCVRFTSKYMWLRFTSTTTGDVTTRDCEDYLFIPEIQAPDISEHLRSGSEVCATFPSEIAPFISNAPGTIDINFKSSLTYSDPKSETYAFDIQYEVTTC